METREGVGSGSACRALFLIQACALLGPLEGTEESYSWMKTLLRRQRLEEGDKHERSQHFFQGMVPLERKGGSISWIYLSIYGLRKTLLSGP